MTIHESLYEAHVQINRAEEEASWGDPLLAIGHIRRANEALAEAMPDLLKQARATHPQRSWNQISAAAGIPVATIRRWGKEAGIA